MIETETLESITEEDTNEAGLLPGEVSELRSEMWAKISEALALGVFTDKEAADWEAGFEACDQLEYMENLIDIVDDFIASGLAVVEQITDTLNTDLLTDREKSAWETKMDILSFQDKSELLHELSSTIKQVANYKRQLTQLLKTYRVPVEQAEVLMKNFESAEADKKEGIVTRVAVEVMAKSDQNQSIKSRINALVADKQFAIARKILSENKIITSGEYAQLISTIDTAEISHTQKLMHAT